MRGTNAAWGLLAGLSVALSCLSDRAYRCESDGQCLAAADGVCASDAWCAYPNESCASGMAYGPFSPPELAGTCLDDTAGDGSGSSDDGDDTGAGSDGDATTGDPVGRCGDEVIDPGETCDDGNHLPGDGCHPLCVEPGTPTWTISWDGEEHGNDGGFSVVVHAEANAIYVTGYTGAPELPEDILVQRYALATGELAWTWTRDGGVGEVDNGERIALDSAGNVVVAGRVTTETGQDVWLAKFNPAGQLLWEQTHDEAGLADTGFGVAILPGDVIVLSAGVEVAPGDSVLLVQRYDPDGAPVGDPVRKDDDLLDWGLDVIADETGYQITGAVGQDTGDAAVWTGRYSTDGTLLWQHVLDNDDSGPWPRGVGQAFDPLGGSVITGVLSTDIIIQHYDAAGMPGAQVVINGPQMAHDEGADIAFLSDGTYVMTGFLDFRTDELQTSDCWTARYAADDTLIWEDRYAGESGQTDKSLGIAVTEDLSAVVVGYETVPGGGQNLWLRRYAL